MPRQRLSSNILNRLKSRVSHSKDIGFFNILMQFLDHRYQPLDVIEDEEYVFSLYSSDDSRRTSYESDISSSEQQQVTNDLNDISQNDIKNYYGPAKRITSKNCRDKFEIFYEIHSGFTADQVLLIEDALQIVADRFFKPEILKNMYQICGTSGCLLTDGVLSQSNLIQNSIYFNRYLLLQYQLICLNHQSQNGEISIINIYPVQEESQSKSNNSHPCILCISHGSTFLIDGDFEIELSQDRLNESVKNSANALFWAGEIVYKMLHNLGHRFNDNDCTNRSQIKIFKQCFLHDGNYIPMKTK